MGRVIGVILGPHGWTKGQLIRIFSSLISVLIVLVASQLWKQIGHTRGVEKTLRTIEENDRCKVIVVQSTVVNNKVKMTSEVTCTKSGNHLISEIKLPAYFKKENNEAQAVVPEEYE